MTSGDSEPVRFLGTLPRVVEQLGKAVTPYIEQLGEAATTFVEAVTPYLEPISTTMATMAERQRISNLMVEAGWLYHQTTPLHLLCRSRGRCQGGLRQTQPILRGKLDQPSVWQLSRNSMTTTLMTKPKLRFGKQLTLTVMGCTGAFAVCYFRK